MHNTAAASIYYIFVVGVVVEVGGGRDASNWQVVGGLDRREYNRPGWMWVIIGSRDIAFVDEVRGFPCQYGLRYIVVLRRLWGRPDARSCCRDLRQRWRFDVLLSLCCMR